ncbi:uncharacterized protein LOC128667257 [Microplitis demolitor]|uniref:uncharacterized protein LOC128667257 n=1 Tax=Microplitis demolitor TaxID=69319 RepID=UPI00235B648E|nr:uncharacterized protein LOC128667257 [Microplitis demolitor]
MLISSKFLSKIICHSLVGNSINVKCSGINFIKLPSKSSSSHLYDHARQLLGMCFNNKFNSIIITADLAEDNEMHRIKNMWNADDSSSSVIVIDGNYKPTKIQINHRSYPSYILSVNSIDTLKTLIGKLKLSSTWSITSIFLILGTAKVSCTDAGKVLGLLWEQDLLLAYFLCKKSVDDNDNDTITIYTLNPFTNYAPPLWQEAETINTVDDECDNKKLTLYKQPMIKDSKICRNITFDKTGRLDGYKIKMTLFHTLPNTTRDHVINIKDTPYKPLYSKEDMTGPYDLSPYLNATSSFYIIHESFQADAIKNGYIDSLVNRNNKYDIHDSKMPLADANYELTDIITQYYEETFSILIKKSDYFTIIEEVNNQYNIQFIIMTIIILLLITALMVIINKTDIGWAVMDVVKMSLSMGALTPMDKLSMRITFFTAFIFFFTTMPEFQGQISAILSKSTQRNVEHLKDLYDNNYHIWYDERLQKNIIEEKLWITDDDKKYLHPSNGINMFTCVMNAQGDSRIACIYPSKFILTFASQLKNLHVLKSPVFRNYNVYWSRKNWVLKNRFDKIATMPVEAGFQYYSHKKRISNILNKMKKIDKIKNAQKYDQLDFYSFEHTYIFMGISLLWVFIIFGIEILLHNYSRLYRQFKMRNCKKKSKSLRSQPRIVFFPGRMVLLNNREEV